LAHLLIRHGNGPNLSPTLVTLLPATYSSKCFNGRRVARTWPPCSTRDSSFVDSCPAPLSSTERMPEPSRGLRSRPGARPLLPLALPPPRPPWPTACARTCCNARCSAPPQPKLSIALPRPCPPDSTGLHFRPQPSPEHRDGREQTTAAACCRG
jgi:hypothetical protein